MLRGMAISARFDALISGGTGLALGIEPVREGPYSWTTNPAIMAALA